MTRRLTIGYITRIFDLGKYGGSKFKQVPKITITGNYLKEFGFSTGDHINVAINKENIVITKTNG